MNRTRTRCSLGEDVFEELLYQVVWSDLFRFGVEVGKYSVSQNGGGEAFEIFAVHRSATIEDRSGFGREDQVLSGSRACSIADVFLNIR